MAQIGRNTPNILLEGTDEADVIQNAPNGTNVTIEGKGDNDTLQNWGSTVTVNGGTGDDNFYNDSTTSDVLINGDEGNDIAQNSGTNVTLNGGAGKDSLQNWGNGVTLNGGTNDDNLYNQGATVQINGDDGNDIAQNNGSNVTLNGGGGSDTLRNLGTGVQINGDEGDDSITNTATDVKIDGGTGSDFIANAAETVTIAGGDDADTIHNDGANVSIDSGAGDDSIQNAGTNVTIGMSGGNDFINNFAANVTIDGGDNADTVGNWQGSDGASINGGAGSDSIRNNNSHSVTLRGGEGDDELINDNGVNSLLDGGKGNDLIQNGGANTTVDGGAGSDTIVNKTVYYNDGAGGVITVSPENVTIDGGDDNDFITNDANAVSISGGAGNDSIENDGGEQVTLGGGQGNDTLIGSAKAEVFVYSGGNDVITNYSGEDTVQIAAGKLNTVNVTDGNVIFKVGKGSLTLKDMQGRVITVTDADGNTTTQRYGETGYSAQDVIKNLVKAWNQTSLGDTAKLDEAIKLSTHFNSIQDAINQMIADCRAAGDPDTFLRKYCGIILDNDDTGAITGWDAGGDAIINGDDIVGETLATAQKVPDYKDTTFTAGNLSIHLGSSGSTLNAAGKKTFDGIYSWWADEAVKLIENSYGVTFKDTDSINIAMVRTASFAGNTRSDGQMQLNQGNIEFSAADDYNGNGIDRTFAHELTHAAQYFLMGGSFPQFLMEGLAELTHGIDDRGGKNTYLTSLSEDPDELAKYLSLDNDGTGEIPYYVAGYMFYRYLARQAALAYDETKDYAFKDGSAISGTDDDELLTGNANGVTISAGGGDDSITAYGTNMLVLGDAGDDSVINNGEGSSLLGGEGNDSIYNYAAQVLINAGNDLDYVENYGSSVTINGGDGDDTILNNGANTGVTGGDGNDFIQSEADNVTLAGGEGDDTVYNRDGSGVVFRYTEGDGDDLIQGFNDTSTLQIIGNYGGSMKSGKNNMLITVGDNVITLAGAINLSKVNIVEMENPLDVTGTDDADSIVNDLDDATIKPGDGDDTIVNGGANVLIEYTAGNDVINGFRADSTLKLGDGSDTYTKATLGNDVVLTVGDYVLTLSGAASLDALNIVGKEIVTAVTFTNSDAAKQTLDADIITADATARTKATRIVGNALDNSILGGSGKDTLYGGKGDDTISGGSGNDKLYGQKGNDLFIYTAGNDIIMDMEAGDTLQLGEDGSLSYETVVSGKNVIVTTDDGSVTLKNAASLDALNIVGEEIQPVETLVAFTNSDAAKQTLDADIITADASARTKATRIVGNALDNSIIGGSGKDTIYGKDGNDTISGGAGNDKLYGQAGNDLFIYTAGNDIIMDMEAGDTLQLGEDGSLSYETVVSGKNVIVTTDDGSVTLKNAASLDALNILGTEIITAVTLTNDDNAKQTLDADIITADATARTKATRIVGNALDNSIVGGSSKDTIYGKDGDDTISGGAGNDKLYGQAGNDLFIYTAGNDIIMDMEAGDTLQLGEDGSLSYETVVSGKNVIVTVGEGLITLTGAASLDALNIVGEEIQPVETLVAFTNSDAAKQTLDADIITADASARTKATRIVGNALDNSIIGGSSKDTIYGKDGDDTISGGAGNDKLYGQAGNDLFIYTAGNDIIMDMEANDTLQLGEDGSLSYETVVSGKNVIVTTDDGSVTLKNAASLDALNILGTEIITAVTLTNDDNAKQTLDADIITADASARTKATRIVGNALDNSIVGGSSKDTIYGKDGNDYIDGGKGNDKLYGQDGADTLWGGAGNDSLWGGDGADVFIYTAGNDIIADYATEDLIKITAGTVTAVSADGDDAIIAFTKGKITVKDAADKILTCEDGGDLVSFNVTPSAQVNAAGTAVTLKANYVFDTFDIATDGGDYAGTLKTVDASAVIHGIAVTGNNLANSIVGSAYDDTLWGGAGNDTLTGNDGADTFIYSAGKDVITDFGDDDLLQITGTFSGTYNKSKNTIAFKVGSTASALTLKDFTATTFNINGDAYHISGTKLVK